MIVQEIHSELFRLQDVKYRDFQAKLMPMVDPETIIGVRTPALRSYAKELLKHPDIDDFLDCLPHQYFDENQLHAFLISNMKNYEDCLAKLKAFLPFVDNWATCDQMSPKVFKKHKQELLSEIQEWLDSSDTYTVRFAVGMLMEHYLDDAFEPAYLEMVAAIRSDEYYINMMVAWYFATALAKQYEAALPFIEEKRLDTWTHNKAIQKSIESRRITQEQKDYLRALKCSRR